MSTISDNLIHFLARHEKDSPMKQLEIFKLIISNGLRTGRVLIKYTHGAAIYNQIVCFTDIPLRECNEHTSIYGKFGIGFKKSFIKNVGGNPARYFLDYIPGKTGTAAQVESRGSLYLNLCHQFDFMMKLDGHIKENPTSPLFDTNGNIVFTANEITDQVSSQVFNFSYDKEMGDLGPARDETKEIDLFYKEREWRLVPSKLAATAGVTMQLPESDSFCYTFQRGDVNMVVVPNEEMRNIVLDYFLKLRLSTDQRLKAFGDNPLPVINYDDLHRW